MSYLFWDFLITETQLGAVQDILHPPLHALYTEAMHICNGCTQWHVCCARLLDSKLGLEASESSCLVTFCVMCDKR